MPSGRGTLLSGRYAIEWHQLWASESTRTPPMTQAQFLDVTVLGGDWGDIYEMYNTPGQLIVGDVAKTQTAEWALFPSYQADSSYDAFQIYEDGQTAFSPHVEFTSYVYGAQAYWFCATRLGDLPD